MRKFAHSGFSSFAFRLEKILFALPFHGFAAKRTASNNVTNEEDEVIGQQPQGAENKRKTGGRQKRISQILPQLREQIPALFDHGMPAERIAEQFSVNKTEILEDMIRDTRGILKRKGPQSTGVNYGQRFRVVGGRTA